MLQFNKTIPAAVVAVIGFITGAVIFHNVLSESAPTKAGTPAADADMPLTQRALERANEVAPAKTAPGDEYKQIQKAAKPTPEPKSPVLVNDRG